VKRYRVTISPYILELIHSHTVYIARDSVANALAWEERLLDAIRAIADAPMASAIDQDGTERIGEEVRKIVFERTFLVHYRVNEQKRLVEVIGFRHGARLPRRGEP
jgi:plasmid stabilization system protein ParE